MFPYSHQVRTAYPRYFMAVRLYDRRKEAIAALEADLRDNPFAADEWTALMAYKLADGDEAGAAAAVEQIKKLRVGVTLEKDP